MCAKRLLVLTRIGLCLSATGLNISYSSAAFSYGTELTHREMVKHLGNTLHCGTFDLKLHRGSVIGVGICGGLAVT